MQAFAQWLGINGFKSPRSTAVSRFDLHKRSQGNGRHDDYDHNRDDEPSGLA